MEVLSYQHHNICCMVDEGKPIAVKPGRALMVPGISVRGRADLRAIVRPEGLCSLKNSNDTIGFV